jgi:hypothetical protein
MNHYQIELKQVDNGFYLEIWDIKTYTKTETVYTNLPDALMALQAAINTVKAQFQHITEGEK